MMGFVVQKDEVSLECGGMRSTFVLYRNGWFRSMDRG